MDSKFTALKNIFGYDTFREGQETLVDSVISGRDVLGIMPTGAGKSICFQLPALLFSGITIVVSPLISLMKDQVAALNQSTVPSQRASTARPWNLPAGDATKLSMSRQNVC